MIYDPHNYRFARSLRELNRDPYDWFEADPDAEYRRHSRKVKTTVAVLVILLVIVNVVYHYYA